MLGESDKLSSRPVKLPWIVPGAPLTFHGAPGNIQGNLDRYEFGGLKQDSGNSIANVLELL